MNNEYNTTTTHETIDTLIKKRLNGQLPNGEENRAIAHSMAKQSELVCNVFHQITPDLIVCRKRTRNKYEVWDGNNRLEALTNFVNGVFQINFDGVWFWWNDLPQDYKDYFLSLQFDVRSYPNNTPDEFMCRKASGYHKGVTATLGEKIQLCVHAPTPAARMLRQLRTNFSWITQYKALALCTRYTALVIAFGMKHPTGDASFSESHGKDFLPIFETGEREPDAEKLSNAYSRISLLVPSYNQAEYEALTMNAKANACKTIAVVAAALVVAVLYDNYQLTDRSWEEGIEYKTRWESPQTKKGEKTVQSIRQQLSGGPAVVHQH